MVKRKDQQQNLFGDAVQVMPFPPEIRMALVTQLALMMLALTDGLMKEAHDE